MPLALFEEKIGKTFNSIFNNKRCTFADITINRLNVCMHGVLHLTPVRLQVEVRFL